MARILWVTFDFPPRQSAGGFRPIKIYKYMDGGAFEADFVTHGATRRFRNALLDESLLAEVDRQPRVWRIPTIIPHDLLLGLAERLRHRRNASKAPGAQTRSTSQSGTDRSRSEIVPQPSAPNRRRGWYGAFAMFMYFPDQLFLWGWLAAFWSVWLHLWRRYDVVYTTSYPESCHLAGLVLRLFGVRWVVDYRYGGPFWIKDLVGYRKPALRQRVDLRFQAYVLRKADIVVVQSDGIATDFCREFALDRARVCVIPSGYDEQDFTGVDSTSPAWRRQDHEIHLVHSGGWVGVTSVERRQMVLALSQLAARLREVGHELVFHALGQDVFGEERQHGLLEFEYQSHGVIVHRHLPRYLVAADGFFLSTLTTSVAPDANGFIPSKVWEYLRAGGPILCVGPQHGLWDLLDTVGVGVHMPLSGDAKVAAEALLRLAAEKSHLHPLVRQQSWAARARQFEEVFSRLLQPVGARSPVGGLRG